MNTQLQWFLENAFATLILLGVLLNLWDATELMLLRIGVLPW